MANIEVPINGTKIIKGRHVGRKFPLNIKTVTDSIFCFILSFACIFNDMTPFALAYYAVKFDKKNWFMPFLATVIGSVLMYRDIRSLKYIIILFIFTTVMAMIEKMDKPLKRASIISFVILIINIIPSAFGVFLLYDMMISVSEAFLCFMGIYIISKSTNTLSLISGREHLWPDETISIIAFASIVILSFKQVPGIMDINISSILYVLFILMTCLRGSIGIGAAIGVMVGFISGIDTYNVGTVIGIYAFSALIASLCKNYGKIGISFGFLISNLLITVFFFDSTAVVLNIYEVIIASILFFLIPNNVVSFFSSITQKTELNDEMALSNGDKVKHTLLEKLEMVSVAFKNLASTYPDKNEKNDLSRKETVNLFNSVAEKACLKCAMKRVCWIGSNEEMYMFMEDMLSIAKKDGYIEYRDLPDHIKEKCVKTDAFLSAFNSVFEIYRVNKIWRGKVLESKQLMSEQLINVSKIIEDLAYQMNMCVDRELESKVKVSLEKQGFKPTSVMVIKGENKNIIIDIKFDVSNYIKDLEYNLIEYMNDVLNSQIQLQRVYQSGDNICMEYRHRDRFGVTTGIAHTKKYGEDISGDNFTAMVLKDGSYIMAISDGMGSGELADKESRVTIDLLMQFLQSGFDRDTTIKLINSSLILKSDTDIFSTIDMCDVDLSMGVAEFIKIGAASTYIKSGDNIEEIKSSSLPVGILKDIQTEFYSRKIDNETLIIMMSDGVSEADKQGGKWIKNEIESIGNENPQLIADKILEKAILKSGMQAIDDMTVLVARIQMSA